jgi:hypothetical protein
LAKEAVEGEEPDQTTVGESYCEAKHVHQGAFLLMDGVVQVALFGFLWVLPLFQEAILLLVFDGKVPSVKVRDFLLQFLHPCFVHELQKLVVETNIKTFILFLFDSTTATRESTSMPRA